MHVYCLKTFKLGTLINKLIMTPQATQEGRYGPNLLFCSSSPARSELPLDLVDLPADIATMERSRQIRSYLTIHRSKLPNSRHSRKICPCPQDVSTNRCFLFKRRAPQLQNRGVWWQAAKRAGRMGRGSAYETCDNGVQVCPQEGRQDSNNVVRDVQLKAAQATSMY